MDGNYYKEINENKPKYDINKLTRLLKYFRI